MDDESTGQRESERRTPQASRRGLLILAGTGLFGLGAWAYADRSPDDSGDVGRSEVPSPTDSSSTPTTDRTTPTETPTDHPVTTTTQTPVPAQHDFVFNTREEMAEIKRRVNSGEKPWVTGFQFLQREANAAMEKAPRSVVDKTSSDFPTHRFVARTHDRDDYFALKEMSDAVLDLGLMYYLTGDDRFAVRAIDFIHHWCLDPKAYMAPNGDALNVGPELRLRILVPKLWWGASFLRDHRRWREIEASMPWRNTTVEDGEAAFHSWVRDLMESMPPAGYAMRNNHWSWRLAFYASAAAYLENEALLDQIFDVWRASKEVPKGHTVLDVEAGSEYYDDKDRPWNAYSRYGKGSGFMASELNREEAFFYTVFNLEALSLTAEVARVQGVDLYSFNAPTDPGTGSTMKKLFNFMVPYAVDPTKWRWGNGSEGIQSGDLQRCKTMFELAHSRWETDRFERAVEGGDLQRPFHSFYVMRHPTLTHANRFDL